MTNKEKLIDYLYGEMSGEERQKFEAILTVDPELKAELEQLQNTRIELSELHDIELETPIIQLNTTRIDLKKWIIRTGIAASFLLMLYFLNTRIEVQSNGFALTFGQTETEPVANPDLEEKMQLLAELDALVKAQEDKWNTKYEEMNKGWNEKFQQQQKTFFVSNKKNSKQALGEKDFLELANMVQDMQLQQQQELNALLNELYQQWQETRNKDLQLIEKEFVNLYQNLQDQQLETEAVLNRIVTAGDR